MLTGHPKGLYRLFFIEMWERLAFYTMVGSLLLYTIDTAQGGLGLSKDIGNEIYGLYLAFVYFTPYLGGLIADRFLGYRKSVFIGGCFFVLGFMLMSVYGHVNFVSGLVCLCVGNGFFKPNISVMVGNLYQPGDPKRDAGFNIFYMGINIGAFIANWLAAWVLGEAGWLWVFRCAGLGMFIGLGVLIASWKVLERADRRPERSPGDSSFRQILAVIIGPALVAGCIGYYLAKVYFKGWFGADFAGLVRPSIVGFLFGMVPILVFFVRLGVTANDDEKPGLLALLPVYLCGATFFMVLHLNGSAMTAWAKESTDRQVPMIAKFQENAFPEYYSNAGEDEPRPNKKTLLITDSAAVANMAGQQRMDQATVGRVDEANPDITVYTLRDAWAEDSELSPEEAAQKKQEVEGEWGLRGCDIYTEVKISKTAGAHGGETLTVEPAEGAKKLKRVVFLRTVGDNTFPVFIVTNEMFKSLYEGYNEKYHKDPIELPPGEYLKLASPIIFQSLNAFFVVAFTPLVVAFFAFLMNRGRGMTTAQKIFWGMVLTMLSLCVMGVAGIVTDNGATKANVMWLVGFYAIITLGELCLSPMALSLVTKLSPKRFVGLTMGGWFIATSFGNNFSGFFGGLQSKMDPTPYFFLLAGICGVVALVILVLLPRLNAAIQKYGA